MFQNMGITLMALLLGENDIIKTSMLALNCGFDTDCTCATAGAVIGILRGADELIRAYGLTEITYALGVKSERRSNKIFDLAEDVAHIGVEFAKSVNSEIVFSGAPEVSYNFEKLPELGFYAEYENMNPSVALGEKRNVLAPFALFVNGELVGERLNCDNWTAENVHLENIKLHKGENRIVLRATRINDDAKYNVTFSRGAACDEHIVWLASKNPYSF